MRYKKRHYPYIVSHRRLTWPHYGRTECEACTNGASYAINYEQDDNQAQLHHIYLCATHERMTRSWPSNWTEIFKDFNNKVGNDAKRQIVRTDIG